MNQNSGLGLPSFCATFSSISWLASRFDDHAWESLQKSTNDESSTIIETESNDLEELELELEPPPDNTVVERPKERGTLTQFCPLCGKNLSLLNMPGHRCPSGSVCDQTLERDKNPREYYSDNSELKKKLLTEINVTKTWTEFGPTQTNCSKNDHSEPKSLTSIILNAKQGLSVNDLILRSYLNPQPLHGGANSVPACLMMHLRSSSSDPKPGTSDQFLGNNSKDAKPGPSPWSLDRSSGNSGEKEADFYVCPGCERFLRTPVYISRHVCPKNGFICRADGCDGRFECKIKLQEHIQRNHFRGVPSRYGCKLCGAILSSKASYIRHSKLIHLRTMPFTCDICGRQFRRKLALGNHRRVHST